MVRRMKPSHRVAALAVAALLLPGLRGTTSWNLDVAAWPAKACTLAGRDLTQVEWNKYFSATGAYRSTCAAQPADP